jgi:hypothetical protein
MNQQQRAVWEKVVELLEDNREYIEADERPEYLALYDKAIVDANALLRQPNECLDCERLSFVRNGLLYGSCAGGSIYGTPVCKKNGVKP